MDPSTIVEAVNAAARCRTGRAPREFTWGPIRRGGCTMLAGARWTLLPDGTATFDAVVTSGDDHDTWAIRHVDLLDARWVTLGSLTTGHPVGGDWRMFVRTLPSRAERYRFRASASFDAGLWDAVAHLKMYSSR
jgi:hypothetical protein